MDYKTYHRSPFKEAHFQLQIGYFLPTSAPPDGAASQNSVKTLLKKSPNDLKTDHFFHEKENNNQPACDEKKYYSTRKKKKSVQLCLVRCEKI